MRLPFRLFLFTLFLPVSSFCLPPAVWSFNGASEVRHSYLIQENFLDLKSYQFHKLSEEEWFESQGGWRLTGGSIGMDLLYTYLDIRLPHSLTEETTVWFRARQEEFYEIKPFRYLVEAEWRPFEWGAVSFLGMPEYDKRHADEGASITLGKHPWNYLRFQQLGQDIYYNEKNFYDDSYYSPHPLETSWEGAFRWKNWRTRFGRLLDLPLKQIFPKQGLTFTYEGEDNRAVLDYHYGRQRLAGFTWRSYDFRKRRESKPYITSSAEKTSPDNRAQQLLYHSADFYWLHPLTSSLHGTLGIREDRFRNLFRQLDFARDSYDFHLWTLQLYGILRHQATPEKAWEYGLYAGDTERATDYLDSTRENKETRKPEVKLRISWELRHLSDKAALMFTTSWNLDDFFRDFWDGGNMSYQRTF